MSYILDALRKADAQRARDTARGINAQTLRTAASADESSRRGWLLWGAAVVVVAVLSWFGWSMYFRSIAPPAEDASGEVVVTAPKSLPRPQLPSAAQTSPVVGSAVQPPPLVLAGPAISPAIPAATIVQGPQVMPPQFTQPPQMASDPRTGQRRGQRPLLPGEGTLGNVGANGGQSGAFQPPGPAAMTAPSMDPPAMPTQPPGGIGGMGGVAPGASPSPVAPYSPPIAANAPPPPPVAGLPADAPKLSISGGVYSANRAQRMLIVNGQVFSEGSEITSGVVLDEVKAKTAVLRFRGQRYTVTF